MQKENKSFSHLGTDQMHKLMECMAVCTSCAKKCIEDGHKNTAVLCTDCAEICDLAIKYKSSQSQFASDITTLCAKICQKCADECEKMEVLHCKECADICRKCGDSCKK